jgi:uncharacterized membrane protein
MSVLDAFIGMLLVFPLLMDAISFLAASIGFEPLELGDWGVPLLALILNALLVRRLLRSRLNWTGAALPGWKAGEVIESAPIDMITRAAAFLGAGLIGFVTIFYLVIVSGVPYADLPMEAMKHGTGAVVAVALVAAAVRRWSRAPWNASFFVRHGMRLARGWHAAVEAAPGRTLWSTVAVLTALFFGVALLRHRAFQSHGFDLGIFTNAMWNLVHTNGYVSSVKGGINLFADHQSPLFWVLAPIFWTVPRPETLLFVQSLGLTAGGPALYYLARAHCGPGHWAQGALPWLYWSWLPLRAANAFDFHPEVFMLPLFLWAFVGFVSDRRWKKALGLLALVAALGAKESAGVVAAGIGIAWSLTRNVGARGRIWPGIALAIAGTALFIFDVKVVPGIFGAEYAYLGSYERFGGRIIDLLLAPITQPAYFISQVLNLPRLNFLFWTLAPLGFLPLLNWRAGMAVLPPYLMLFLGEGDQRVSMAFHYGIEPGSALFWALPLGLAAFARRVGWNRAGIWVLLCACAFFGPSEFVRVRGYLPSGHTQWLEGDALPCVNREIALAASDVLIPHLATRAWISYPDVLDRGPSVGRVACVVTDLSGRMDNWPLGEQGVERVLANLPAQGYSEAYRCGRFSVYQLGTSGCMRCMPKCDTPPY